MNPWKFHSVRSVQLLQKKTATNNTISMKKTQSTLKEKIVITSKMVQPI